VNRAPAVAEPGRKRLGLVDRRLGSLELLPLLDYCTRFGKPRLQGLGMRLRDDRRRGAARQGSVGSGTGNHGATDQEGEPALHEADATVSPATCLATRRIVPERLDTRRGRPRPKEARGNLIDYEIVLLLDPELPDERQNEIVTRTRELVERGGGTFEGHDVWGRRRLAYEIDHKPEGAYHLLTFSAEPGTLDEISRVLKITEGVIRHLAVKRPKPGPTPTAAPPSDDREPEYPEPAFESGRDE
jgi:small subunit ribosomal protein S6